MAKTKGAAIQIGQLNLRIPGRSADTAHRVGNGIAQSLAQQSPAGPRSRLGALSVRVQASPNATESEMSEAVAVAIGDALRKRDGGSY